METNHIILFSRITDWKPSIILIASKMDTFNFNTLKCPMEIILLNSNQFKQVTVIVKKIWKSGIVMLRSTLKRIFWLKTLVHSS